MAKQQTHQNKHNLPCYFRILVGAVTLALLLTSLVFLDNQSISIVHKVTSYGSSILYRSTNPVTARDFLPNEGKVTSERNKIVSRDSNGTTTTKGGLQASTKPDQSLSNQTTAKPKQGPDPSSNPENKMDSHLSQLTTVATENNTKSIENTHRSSVNSTTKSLKNIHGSSEYSTTERNIENDESFDKKPSPAPGSPKGTKNQATPGSQVSREKYMYLIYLCDKKAYCYGLGDRQRAIVSFYLLAQACHRKYGVIMTSPSPLTDLYQPNEVQWLISDDELANKTKKELVLFGKANLPLDTMDFNKVHPEDVVYVRTNYNVMTLLNTNPMYKDKIPKGPRWQIFASTWLKLFVPTQLLRDDLNKMLKQVVDAMNNEFQAFKQFNMTGCNKTCDELSKNSTVSSKQCHDNRTTDLLLKDNTPNYCQVTPPKLRPSLSPEDVTKLKGYATVDLNLICVHIRIGKSATMPWEPKRNKVEDLLAVWKFLQPYVEGGHHVYLATDSQEVREAANAQFGYRMHTSSKPIMHITDIGKGHDEKEGFKLTAMEQLLLSTSCHTLVISYSNLSLKAAMLRAYLQKVDRLFMFKGGKVFPFGKSRLF